MKLYIVGTFTSSDRINVLHYYMFHGEMERADIVFPENPSHNLDDDLSLPPVITRNVYRMPHVFKPRTSLIVSSEVRSVLGDLPHVVYLEVKFKKLVEYAYSAGDFSYFRRKEFVRDPYAQDPETLLARLPDVPHLHDKVGPYFEIVNANYMDIIKAFPNRQVVSFTYPYLGMEEPDVLEVSEEMLLAYPILWAPCGIVMTEKLYEKLDKYIDKDYFSVTGVGK
jgi:hypothetical protein